MRRKANKKSYKSRLADLDDDDDGDVNWESKQCGSPKRKKDIENQSFFPDGRQKVLIRGQESIGIEF